MSEHSKDFIHEDQFVYLTSEEAELVSGGRGFWQGAENVSAAIQTLVRRCQNRRGRNCVQQAWDSFRNFQRQSDRILGNIPPIT